MKSGELFHSHLLYFLESSTSNFHVFIMKIIRKCNKDGITGDNMLPRDHCSLLLCLFTFDHVALHSFTFSVVVDKISRALKQGGVLVTMYLDSKKLVRLMESNAVERVGFLNFNESSDSIEKTCGLSTAIDLIASKKLLKPNDFCGSTLEENSVGSIGAFKFVTSSLLFH